MSFEDNIYPVPPRLLESKDLPKPYITSFEEYQKLWQESVDNPSEFFAKVKKKKDYLTDLFMHLADMIYLL
jgi:acetyl-CoA synthetase